MSRPHEKILRYYKIKMRNLLQKIYQNKIQKIRLGYGKLLLFIIYCSIYQNIKRKNMGNYISSSPLQPLLNIISSFKALQCKDKNTIQHICCSPECTHPSFHCSQNSCSFCKNNHRHCYVIKMSKWLKVIQERFDKSKKLIQQFLESQNQILKKFAQIRQESLKIVFFGSLQDRVASKLTRVFIEKKHHQIDGADANFISELLRDSLEDQQQEYQNQVLNEFIMKSENIIQTYQEVKLSTLKLIAGRTQLDSKIILLREEQNLIKKWLQKGSCFEFDYWMKKSDINLKLIFRASENSFSAFKFHQSCDNISHTLVVIKTQFGKKIGGYTPLTWDSSRGYSKDSAGKSFIFSLNLKKKMQLTRPQYAIYCNNQEGPIFGDGYDIFLTDECNTNNCYANFPTSYNQKSNGYENGQRSYTDFTGSPSGKKFKVLEYQVFKVYGK